MLSLLLLTVAAFYAFRRRPGEIYEAQDQRQKAGLEPGFGENADERAH